ncbi:hypothetical protein [uncultured Hymenobacter sp.]|uniref:hypothetical protein n=1 Tax=uncultured Hymenobacter sp. TaxID=170016 RepID=UPI0035CC0CD2
MVQVCLQDLVRQGVYHIDHGGSGADVRRRTLVRTCVHVLDAPLLTQGLSVRPGTRRTLRLVNFLVDLFFIKYAGSSYEPVPVDQRQQRGDVRPFARDFEVLLSPGHNAGYVCLLVRQECLLVAAELCSHVVGLSYRTINEDRAPARQNMLRMAEYPSERANKYLKDLFSAAF